MEQTHAYAPLHRLSSVSCQGDKHERSREQVSPSDKRMACHRIVSYVVDSLASTAAPMTPNDRRQRRAGTMYAQNDAADRRVRCTPRLDVTPSIS